MNQLRTTETATDAAPPVKPILSGGALGPRRWDASAIPTPQEVAVTAPAQDTVEPDTTDDQDGAITDDSTAGALRRAAAYIAEHGVTPELAEALGNVARKVIEDGDPDGAGRELADALAAQASLDLTDPAVVTAHFVQLADGVVASAQLAADPRLSDPTYRVLPPDSDDWFRHLHQAEVATHTAGGAPGAGNPDEAFHQRRILALVQAYAQYWGSGHGRTLKAEYAAQLADAAAFLATEAVTASLAGLETNPHDVADRLHRAIDNAQAVHLAEVGGHSETQAYADSRFHTAILAAEDAMGATSNRPRMALALRTALDMVIDEVCGGGDAGPAGAPAAEVPTAPPEGENAQPTDTTSGGAQ